MSDRHEQPGPTEIAGAGDSGRRRPANYSSDEDLDEQLPELHHVPAEGPLDSEHFDARGESKAG